MWVEICRKLTETSESCRLKAYWDPNGRVWTVGFGATGPGITEGVVWTSEHADADLDTRLMGIGAFIDAHVHCPLNDNQKAALADFVYNVGEGNFLGSTMLKLLNGVQYTLSAAAAEFPKWNKSGGTVLKGLVNRREAERVLFLTPVGEPKPVAVATQPAQLKPNPLMALFQWLSNLIKR